MAKAKGTPVGIVGRCIYGCGPEHAGPLTKEHILAANLGGEFMLLDASCGMCQDIINTQVETPCMRAMFKEIRYRRGIGSRRVNERPDRLHVWRRPATEGEPSDRPFNPEDWQATTVPYQEHPSLLVLPVYSLPGLLRGLDPAASLEEEPGTWWHIEPWRRKEGDTDEFSVQTKLSSAVFCRLIAKTAHCAAVSQFGLEGFTPFLTDMILGRDLSQLRYLVGGISSGGPTAASNHEIAFARPRSEALKPYILCTVRIFADLGAPTYVAVVGKEK